MVAAVKEELSQDKIWMVIDNLGQEMVVPIEQIASVANKVVLFSDSSQANLAMNGKSGIFLAERRLS
jgi:hypothetical protein